MKRVTDPSMCVEEPGDTTDNSSRAVISRAARVLRTLEQAPHGMTIAQITRASELPRTTVQRLVNSLHAEQLVTLRGTQVGLGPALARLAAAAKQDIRMQLRPHLESLSLETGESVDLWALQDNQVVLIDQVVAPQEVRIVLSVGSALPLTCTAPGKALLAEWTDQAITEKFSGPLPSPTAHSLNTLTALLQNIRAIRQSGLAFDFEEHGEDICALACSLALGGCEAYAIAIPAPARRFHARQASLEAALRRIKVAIER